MKLYYNRFTRATRPRWLLEELEVPYELVVVDLAKGEHKSEEFLQKHPLGKVPALEDEGQVLLESVAICLYLADKHAEKGLGPRPEERADYYTWTIYTQVTVEPEIARYGMATNARFGTPDPAVAESARAALHKLLLPLEHHLTGREFVCGPRFTAADVVVGSNLAWANGMKLLDGFPALQAYVARVSARPAFARGRT